jgi:hypothetical protein
VIENSDIASAVEKNAEAVEDLLNSLITISLT